MIIFNIFESKFISDKVLIKSAGEFCLNIYPLVMFSLTNSFAKPEIPAQIGLLNEANSKILDSILFCKLLYHLNEEVKYLPLDIQLSGHLLIGLLSNTF